MANNVYYKGNELWRRVKDPGRKAVFETPEDLWAKAVEYFEWVAATPLTTEKLFCHQGDVVRGTEEHPRAMTKGEFQTFAGISHTTMDNYKKKEEFVAVVEEIEEVIFTQKFQGASAGLFKENIIARETGLADRSERKNTGTININVTDDEADL